MTTPGAGSSQPPSSLPRHFSAPDPTTLGKSDTELPSHPNPGTQTKRRFAVRLCYKSRNTNTKKGVAGAERRKRDRNNPHPVQGTPSLQTQHIWPQQITKASTLTASHNNAFYSQALLHSADHRRRVHLLPPFSTPPRPVPVSSKEKKERKNCRPKGHFPSGVALASARSFQLRVDRL